MSALPPKADMCTALAYVRFGPKADICGASRHVRFAPESGHAQRTHLTCFYRVRSAHRELQQFDRVEVLHAAPDAFGRIEQHVGLGGIRIAKDRDARTIDDEVAALEIAERHRERIRGNVW